MFGERGGKRLSTARHATPTADDHVFTSPFRSPGRILKKEREMDAEEHQDERDAYEARQKEDVPDDKCPEKLLQCSSRW